MFRGVLSFAATVPYGGAYGPFAVLLVKIAQE